MIKRAIKIIFINILVLIGLLFLLNIGSVILYQSYQVFKSDQSNFDKIPNLPNYKNIDWADKHFAEFQKLPTEYASYIGWRRSAYTGETIEITKEGLRYTPQSELTDENSLLVAFLGGSTMWGTGSNSENTIPALFSEISEGKYRTINLAESAYRAFQSYLFLLLQINEGLKPDVVVSYSGVNERAGFVAAHQSISHSREYQLRSVMKGMDRKSNKLSFRNFFFGPVEEFLSIIKGKYSKSQHSTYYEVGPERTEKVASALLDSWMATKLLVEQNGGIYVCVLQPNTAIGKPSLDHLDLSNEYLVPYQHLYPVVLDLLQSPEYLDLSENFIDLTSVFDGNEKFYIDFCHVSPNGNRIVAKTLYDHIQKRTQKK
jgi:hypothetical protein